MHGYGSISHTVLLNKWRDIGLLRSAMQEVTIILQALSTKKPKYVREMYCQMYIFDTTIANTIFQEAYIANALVNPQGLPYMFYKMNLLLEYQNGEFKCFQANQVLSLQKTNKIFWLHALLVDTLLKVQKILYRAIIGNKKSGKSPT